MTATLRGPAPGHDALVASDTDLPTAFRRLASHFPTGVTVVATMMDGRPYGTTVNSFTTVSTDPLSVLVCLNRNGRLNRRLRASGHFSVSLLSEQQEHTARWFADSRRGEAADEFGGEEWHTAPRTGSPVLASAVGYFDCRVSQLVDAGTHDVVIGEVLDLGHLNDRPPLLFWRSKLGAVATFAR
ncbi:flavin reductase family protein [Streptomyces sp. NPDC126499]|uniref:flavin reductase family protein n=1 Tax=Streptomyces sp. NPDC126499 TaxID=3155314 RepID=UPI003322199C